MHHIFHVIKDPVHGTMQFTSNEDDWVKPFIDSPNFQRLRHIKQLGLGDFIFPGAVHTRFNHCLGCCYVAGQIAHKIGLTEDEKQLVMIAGLLHDIGHGPFSHTFEDIFHNRIIKHEDWTPFFLAEFGCDEFFSYYNRRNPHYRLTDEKFQTIAEMIMHQTSKKHVLADIVSSQLDADRLDYLLRDNHFCGVRYGEFDFRWMLHCLTIVQTKDGKRLGITHKGIGVVEHYLMARRLMIRNIYQSQKKLAFEFLLVHLLAALSDQLENTSDFSMLSKSRLGEFLIAVNRFNQIASTQKTDQLTKQKFLEQNYCNYKQLCDYDVFALIKQLAALPNTHQVIQIAKRLEERKMPKILRLDNANLNWVESELQEFKQKHKNDFQDWQLMLIQTPHQAYSGEDDPIWVINEQGKIQPIENYSIMLNAISDTLEHIAFLCIDQLLENDNRVKKFLDSVKKYSLV